MLTIRKSRREFLIDVTTIGAGICASPFLLYNNRLFKSAYAGENVPSKSKVIIAQEKKLINVNGKADTSRITMVIDSALEKITDTKKPSDAWRKLFDENDIVGIKVNCLTGKRFSPHVELIEAIINGLKTTGFNSW